MAHVEPLKIVLVNDLYKLNNMNIPLETTKKEVKDIAEAAKEILNEVFPNPQFSFQEGTTVIY